MLDTRQMSTYDFTVAGQTFNLDQIAIVDFIGVTPRPSELALLPSSGHMMAMRNGGTRIGYLIAMMNGDTVVWQEEGNGRRSIPMQQIARIYLNAGAARNVYGFTGRRASAYGQGYSATGSQILVRNMMVPGNQSWTDTGIDVVRGDVLRFDDQGGITFIEGPNNTANAGGTPEMKNDRYPVPSAGVGALIGKVGSSGTPFFIGAGTHPVTVPATGHLWLGVNDDYFGDNTGAFSVTIIRGR